jgi:hypothetical protein
MNHDKPMMIGFIGDEMTLKATLFVCIPILIFKGLVSCVTSPKQILQPLMTSIATGVFFFMIFILFKNNNSGLT